MKTNVEFKSDKFPPYEGEEEEVNPDLWGKRLAENLTVKLTEKGIEIGEIYAEDWGWGIPVKNEAFQMWIGCGHYQEYPNGYLVFVQPSKPLIRKGLFKKIDTTTDVERVTKAIDEILNADPEIRDFKWWDEGKMIAD
jgi:hypothetical protein